MAMTRDLCDGSISVKIQAGKLQVNEVSNIYLEVNMSPQTQTPHLSSELTSGETPA